MRCWNLFSTSGRQRTVRFWFIRRDNWKSLCPVGAGWNRRNLCACGGEENGDVDGTLEKCEVVIDRVYHTKANQQAMMETFRAYTYLDTYGQLKCSGLHPDSVSLRRILAHALDIPQTHGACDQAENRRRIRGEADRGGGSLPGDRDDEDGKGGEDGLYPL